MRIKALILSILFLLTLFSVATAFSPEKKGVLLLNSYHIGFGWHDDITKGVQDTLKKSGINYELFVEHFDTVRFPVAEARPLMDFIMLEKYKNRKIDVIIVADDYGLQHLIDTKMYERAPVVFLGVNSLRRVDVARSLGMTGVIETVEFKRTFELMMRLHPNLERIVPVVGNSSTGQKHLKNMRVEFNQINTDIELLQPEKWTFASLAKKLKSYDPGTTAIIQASFHRDYENNLAGSIGNYTFFNQFDLPAYTMWKTSGVGTGMLGGVVSDGIVHGTLAAEKALAILDGANPLDLPIDSGSKINLPMFDAQLLSKFGIHPDFLPQYSVLVNVPKTFYSEYYGYIWIVASFLLIQVVGGVMYFVLMQDRRRLIDVAVDQHEELMEIRHRLERQDLGHDKDIPEQCPNVDEVFQTLSTVLGRIKVDE